MKVLVPLGRKWELHAKKQEFSERSATTLIACACLLAPTTYRVPSLTVCKIDSQTQVHSSARYRTNSATSLTLLRIFFRSTQSRCFPGNVTGRGFLHKMAAIGQPWRRLQPHDGCHRCTSDTSCACSTKRLRIEACCVHDADAQSISLALMT
jgi:hypothetical protein